MPSSPGRHAAPEEIRADVADFEVPQRTAIRPSREQAIDVSLTNGRDFKAAKTGGALEADARDGETFAS